MLVAERYRLGTSLGRGGMGEVFRAVDEQLGRPVAVKLMLPSDRDPSAVERFHREARAAAQLNDPHVVAVYDFGQHGNEFFLVMELVDGRTVAGELAEHGPLPKDRAIDIVEQAALGLAAAHRENVVHRDVKPGNLLVTPEGTVKVADFGIAHRADEGTTALTATGQLIGSALYLAPERARGGRAGKPSDVYSLGCVLYQLLTGQPPFAGEHPAAILYQHVDAEPALPSLIRPELAGGFETALFRMLAKDPAERPTAEEIAAGSLRAPAALATTAVVAPTVRAAAVVPVETMPIAPVIPPPPPSSGWQTRQKALLAGGIAVAAAAAAVLVGVLLNGNNDPRLPETNNVGPGSGVTASTPTAPANPSSSGPEQAGNTSQPTQSSSPKPSQTPSSQNTPTRSPSSGTPSTTAPSRTPTPTEPTKSTAPTTPATSAPTTAPSSTPPTENPSTPPPSSATPPAEG
ncbi:protein kinase [Kribbella sp. NPDC051620]|uniref:serine/threonine-protein kinase n=1 Tax=Kribbella sp. NPDC051620 TaxID=3364120 RepID=UPI0037916F73